nr:hypothetical protein [Tanacetum cinerariifolium]
FHALKLVVRTEKIQDVFETALPPRPVGVEDAPVDPQALAEWTAKYDRHNEVACFMLGPEEDPEDDQADYPTDGGDDLALSAREAEALEPDEPIHAPGSPISIPLSQTRLRMARKTVRPEPPMSASMEASIARQTALLLPPLPIPSPPLPLPSPLTTSPTDTGAP